MIFYRSVTMAQCTREFVKGEALSSKPGQVEQAAYA